MLLDSIIEKRIGFTGFPKNTVDRDHSKKVKCEEFGIVACLNNYCRTSDLLPTLK
jgi:hypothetical protein